MTRLAAAFAFFAAFALSLGVAYAHDTAQVPSKQRRVVVVEAAAGDHSVPDLATLEGDRVTIEDAATILPGETRSYYTDGGREVLVTRGEGERLTIEVDGKKVELGGEIEELAHLSGPGTGGGERRVIVRHHDKSDAGDAEGAEVSEEIEVELAHAADGVEGGEPPVIVEIVDEADGRVQRRVVVLQSKTTAAP
jgi:hypothetical protein